LRVCKPVATGLIGVADDTRLLAESAGSGQSFAEVTRFTFAEPAAPPIAARAAGVSLTLAGLVGAVRSQLRLDTLLLTEGVGGLLCPITESETVADLIRELAFPTLVVARRSLGTLNHTLLTLEAARSRGLDVIGVVVNETTPPAGLAEETNVEELRRRVAVPILGVVPHGGPRADAADQAPFAGGGWQDMIASALRHRA
jgi:dethiobiotin synthetase